MKPDEMIYGLLIHLGRNMWAPHKAADHVRCSYLAAVDQLAGARGMVERERREMSLET